MAKVLVIGGTGFISRELVRQLVRKGVDVTVLSRSKPKEDVEWLQADITDMVKLKEVLNNHSYNVIYHTASLPGDTGNPEQMINVNIGGLTHILEFARHRDVKRFVLTSSTSAYEWYPATKFNPPKYMPVDEDHCRPKDMYSTTKRIQLPMFSPQELSHFVDIRDVAQMHIIAGTYSKAIGEIFNCCGAKATRGSELVVSRIFRTFVWPRNPAGSWEPLCSSLPRGYPLGRAPYAAISFPWPSSGRRCA